MAQYATLQEADAYFGQRLHSDLWEGSPPADRNKALIAATQRIDRLNYSGMKAAAYTVKLSLGGTDNCDAVYAAGAGQELEFPRGKDTAVPNDIKTACYEIAYALLDGVDPEKEIEDLATTSRGFSSVRSASDRSFALEHIAAGIPSALAWRFLRPYLRDAKNVKLSRVN